MRGEYRSVPTLNKWLEGSIGWDASVAQTGPVPLRWTNSAGVSWKLIPDIKNGVLLTGTDNPYWHGRPLDGRLFQIVLRRDAGGDFLPEVSGFSFLGAFYAKVDSPP
jgi:hypothetical protein